MTTNLYTLIINVKGGTTMEFYLDLLKKLIVQNGEVVIVLVVIIFAFLVWKYRRSSWGRKVLTSLITEAEFSGMKGKDKLLQVMQKYRDLCPIFVRVFITDEFLKNVIETILSGLQEVFNDKKEENLKIAEEILKKG